MCRLGSGDVSTGLNLIAAMERWAGGCGCGTVALTVADPLPWPVSFSMHIHISHAMTKSKNRLGGLKSDIHASALQVARQCLFTSVYSKGEQLFYARSLSA